MKKILSHLHSGFRKLTDREKEFLDDLRDCCREQHIEWLYKKIKARIKSCCVNNHLDIKIIAPEGDWGDEVFDVRYTLSEKYGNFIRAEQIFSHGFNWNDADPYKGNPLRIHWEIDL